MSEKDLVTSEGNVSEVATYKNRLVTMRRSLGFDIETKKLIEIAEQCHVLKSNCDPDDIFYDKAEEEGFVTSIAPGIENFATLAFQKPWTRQLNEDEFIYYSSFYLEVFFRQHRNIDRLGLFAYKHGYLDEEKKRGPAVILTGLASIVEKKTKDIVYRKEGKNFILIKDNFFTFIENYQHTS